MPAQKRRPTAAALAPSHGRCRRQHRVSSASREDSRRRRRCLRSRSEGRCRRASGRRKRACDSHRGRLHAVCADEPRDRSAHPGLLAEFGAAAECVPATRLSAAHRYAYRARPALVAGVAGDRPRGDPRAAAPHRRDVHVRRRYASRAQPPRPPAYPGPRAGRLRAFTTSDPVASLSAASDSRLAVAAWLTWDWRTRHVIVQASTRAGAWVPAETLSDRGVEASKLDVAVGGRRAIVSWIEAHHGVAILRVAEYRRGHWHRIRLPQNAAAAMQASAAAAGDGTAAVAWTVQADARLVLRAARINGSGRASAVRDLSSPPHSVEAFTVTAGTRRLAVAWRERDSTSSSLLVAHAPCRGPHVEPADSRGDRRGIGHADRQGWSVRACRRVDEPWLHGRWTARSARRSTWPGGAPTRSRHAAPSAEDRDSGRDAYRRWSACRLVRRDIPASRAAGCAHHGNGRPPGRTCARFLLWHLAAPAACRQPHRREREPRPAPLRAHTAIALHSDGRGGHRGGIPPRGEQLGYRRGVRRRLGKRRGRCPWARMARTRRPSVLAKMTSALGLG